MLKTLRPLVLLIIVITTGGSLSAERLGEAWRDQIAQSSDLLRSGHFAESLAISSRVADDMIAHLGTGPEAAEVLAVVLTHKALASAGLRRYDDAMWYWDLAAALYPAVTRSDVSMFGDAGAYLRDHMPPAEDDSLPVFHMEGPQAVGDLVAPRLLKKRFPSFPEGAHAFGLEDVTIVEVHVDQTGKVSRPHIVRRASAPSFSYVALEAMRNWRFAPGTKNRIPADMRYAVTVFYRFH